MNLQEKIDKNTVLHYVESQVAHYDDEDKEIVDSYSLSFSFHNCHYYVYVKRKDIDQNREYVLLEGDSELFYSFESKCEGELWDIIKQKCNDFDIWKSNL